MYDTTRLRIMQEIYLNPCIHKRGLSKKLKLTMPSIDYAIKKISTLLQERKAGNQLQYSLDYSKEALTPVLYAVEQARIEKLPSKIRLAISEFMKELAEKPIIALIFGSYARGEHTSSSDIDILLVFQSIKKPGEIESTAKRISMRTNTRINPVYLGYKEFRESFHNSTKAFFKNIRKEKILLEGIEWWRQLENESA
jgi:predicted nucleotidyltransferase